MAKELPYFKFEPNQWENGNIQIFNHEQKGIFIDLCSMYWSRLGDLKYRLAVAKICNGNATALDLLCSENIFYIKEGYICIDFLNEQLSDFKNVSKANSKNASIGWEKRRSDAVALRSKNERNTIREEKRREEKRKEDKIITKKEKVFNFRKELLDFGFKEDLVIDWLKVRKTKKATNTKTAYNSFLKQINLINKPINEILETCVEKSWSGLKAEWFNNLSKQNNTTGTKEILTATDRLNEALGIIK